MIILIVKVSPSLSLYVQECGRFQDITLRSACMHDRFHPPPFYPIHNDSLTTWNSPPTSHTSQDDNYIG